MYSEEEEEYILQSMEQQNIMTTEFENPFRLPSDEQVFLMRDEQRKQAKEERERTKNFTSMGQNYINYETTANKAYKR